MSSLEHWGIRRDTAERHRLRLICFPFAGGGASAFHGWRPHLPDWVEFCVLALPGREVRHREQPFTDIPALIQQLCPLLLERRELPYALFGHSMGALLALELAQQFLHHGVVPHRVFLSACRPPHLERLLPALHKIDDDVSFLDQLQRQYRKLPEALFSDERLLDSVTRTLRADFTMFETYRGSSSQPLQSPLTVFGGTQDWFSIEDLSAWQQYTTNESKVVMMPGDHFFMQSCAPQLTAQMFADLQSSE